MRTPSKGGRSIQRTIVSTWPYRVLADLFYFRQISRFAPLNDVVRKRN